MDIDIVISFGYNLNIKLIYHEVPMSTLAVENDPAAVGVKTYTFKLIGDTRERTIVCPRSSWSQALEYIKNNELPTFKDSNPRLRFISAR